MSTRTNLFLRIAVGAILPAFWLPRLGSAQEPAAPRPTAKALSSQRDKLDETLWAQEVAAQKHEDVFVKFWDDLRAKNNAWDVWEAMRFDTLILGEPGPPQRKDLGITITSLGKPTRSITRENFPVELAKLRESGYRVVQTDWHHSQFDMPKDAPARSMVSFQIHVVRNAAKSAGVQRIIIKGKLDVVWSGKEDLAGRPIAQSFATRDVQILTRDSDVAFKEVLAAQTDAKKKRLMPLLIYDLDGDGLSEIILGGLSLIYRNRGEGKFDAEPLASTDIDMFDAAILADFNADGHVDLVYVDPERKPRILLGQKEGRFTNSSRQCAEAFLELPKSFTAGDIDGDGDLDLFIGQYKFPYVEGSMPTPFYDSNDGYPAVLLTNDGRGNFTDVTEKAGLAKKRHRRVFSSSLIDLDDDGDLDLISVNDFCGIDLFANDGKGQFVDITGQLGENRHLFGMAHTFGDYNLDGKLDFYGIGMSSTTARRLEAMGLGRSDKPDINAARMKMGYGNRMFLGTEVDGKRTFVQAPFNDQIARTGWSWGTTSPDFDLDGDRDIFVVNGHTSGQSARDYCTRYWCHDVYTGSSKDDPELSKLFGDSLRELNGGKISWNGFENDVLWMNEGGKAFFDAAFLLGVAFQSDGRAAASDDLDGDGRPDLLVVEYKSERVGHAEYKLRALSNRLETGRHWIGVRLPDTPGQSPIGAVVTLRAGGRTQIARYVTGDSFSTQHAATLHFGLGNETVVDWLEIRWPNGARQRLERPQIDQYHRAAGTKAGQANSP